MNHTIIYENYEELVNGVFHYQNQQNDIRVFCVKIIVGTMGLIGLLGLSNLGLSRLNFSVIAAIIPILALFAVSSSILNDLFYKEQLKMCFFFEALRLEQEHAWIPEFHNCLLIEESKKEHYAPGKRQVYFYERCIAMLMWMSATALWRIPIFCNPVGFTVIYSSFLFLFLLYVYIINYYLKKVYSPYKLQEKKLKRVINPEVESLVSSLHSKGKELTQNLSDIKMKFKNLTLTVITAIFVSAAYVSGVEQSLIPLTDQSISIQLQYINLHKLGVISVLAFFAIFSLTLIRYLDVIICHAQMRNLYKALKKMEEGYPNLAKPYEFLAKTLYGRKYIDPIIMDALFYTSFNLVIIIFGTIMAMTQLQSQSMVTIVGSFTMLGILLISEIISLFLTHKQKVIFE